MNEQESQTQPPPPSLQDLLFHQLVKRNDEDFRLLCKTLKETKKRINSLPESERYEAGCEEFTLLMADPTNYFYFQNPSKVTFSTEQLESAHQFLTQNSHCWGKVSPSVIPVSEILRHNYEASWIHALPLIGVDTCFTNIPDTSDCHFSISAGSIFTLSAILFSSSCRSSGWIRASRELVSNSPTNHSILRLIKQIDFDLYLKLIEIPFWKNSMPQFFIESSTTTKDFFFNSSHLQQHHQ